MAEIVRYVDTTVGSSGDGISWATAYKSLVDWNTAEANDLVAAGNTHTVNCRGGADVVANATMVDMASWTTGASNYVTINMQGTGNGKLDESKYHLSKTSSSATPSNILSVASYTRLRNHQFKFRINTGSNAARACVIFPTGRVGCDVDGGVFDIGGTHATAGARAFEITGAGAGTQNEKIKNNIIIDSNTSNVGVVNTSLSAGLDRVKFYNNTIINTTGGTKKACVLGSTTGFKFVNNIFQGYTTDVEFTTGSLESGSDYNLTSGATFPGAGTHNVTSTTLTFAGSGSYKLASTDTAARGAGIGPSADANVPTTDIDGNTRSGATTDIGSDLYTAANATISLNSESVTTTTATVSVNTDQTSGTLYIVASSTLADITGVTAAQIKAGQNASGGTAAFSGNAAISTTTASGSLTGMTAGTTYHYAAIQNNTNGDSNIIVDSLVTSSLPALSGPTASGLAATFVSANIGATTDQASGTLYVVVGTASTQIDTITAQQIKDGQIDSGAAAFRAGNSAISTSFTSVPLSGFAVGATYHYAIVQENSNGFSDIEKSTFTATLPATGAGYSRSRVVN